MNFKRTRTVRYLSLVILFIFIYSFIGVNDIVLVAQGNDQPASHSDKRRDEKKEDRFEDVLERMRKAEEQAYEKIEKGESIDEEEKEIEKQEAEIEQRDGEIRMQFKQTEEKIKDLPEEIKQRHRDFVENYEKNYKTLKTNINNIKKARTRTEKQEAHRKAKEYFERVNPPKKRIPLDPNKLPHRVEEHKELRKPRLNREEFGKGSAQLTASSNHRPEPILVAANGSLDGLMAVQDYALGTENYLQLAALAPPTQDDLGETIEVQFTSDIQQLAADLGNSPVKIFNYIRNNFEYEPYYGSLKGSAQTLLEMAGNDFDQASLLIALLRASSIPARYVYGTIEMPLEKFMNWVGGVTDINTAVQILAAAGVPGQTLSEGGQIKYVQFEHVWVEAYVPYGNYRGSMRDDTIKTWIPMDPSFKQYGYNKGMDLYQAMAINGEQFIMDYITDTSPSPIPDELNDLFPDYTKSPYQYYSKRFFDYIEANYPDATIEDIIGADTIEGAKTIIPKDHPFLLGSLPYTIVTKGVSYSEVPDTMTHKISFAVKDPDSFNLDISYTALLPGIAGKRITLSYIPASSADEVLVTHYGSMLNVPPYLLKVKPVLKIGGTSVATGQAIGLGHEESFSMTFRMPGKNTDTVTNKVTAGDYSAIALQYYNTPVETVGARMEDLHDNVDAQSTDLDDLLGQMLYNIGVSYFHHLAFEEGLYAKNFQMIITREPSEAIATSQANTEWLYGIPYRVTEGGVAFDVDKNVKANFPIDGDQQRAKDFMVVSGIGTSSWEDMALQSFFNIRSVSAAKLLKKAFQNGIPIYEIDNTNVSTLVAQLQVDAEVKTAIRNAANAGKKVITPQTSIQYNDWNGAGYIVIDPTTGSGAFMISEGLAGAAISYPLPESERDLDELYRKLCDRNRWIIVMAAGSKIGVPYVWGGGRERDSYGTDCSGLIVWCYNLVKFNSVVAKKVKGREETVNALDQFNASIGTTTPFYGDLVFFRGTQDTNEDCMKNEADKGTHVGIAIQNGWYIHASSVMGEVVFAKINNERKLFEQQAIWAQCGGSQIDFPNKCPRYVCDYGYISTGKVFEHFDGYRYAKEFDDPNICPME